MTPEHTHLALNHIPIIGLACAVVPLLAGILANNKTAMLAGLLLAMVCGWSTFPIMKSGEQSYERYGSVSLRGYLDPEAKAWLEAHEERAETGVKILYVTAVLATICLPLVFWRSDWGRWGSVLVALACVASVGVGMWIADSGGKIRRVDFRESVSPSPEDR